MATVLATQLAQIAAKSRNPLDLKAQKKAHSQSLLFDQHVAASQDFDTIYQICLEGYLELCDLDRRFIGFSRSIFSEQSKREERSQMTTAHNKELDEVLESFLGLVGAKLLLKPALKAVEWLVRRFRVHENNVQYLVFTFLPYHSMPIFATLLSILPQNLPPILKFLHPYTESFACPPRHAIVYTATNNQPFFAAFNSYVIGVCRAGKDYPAILSYWATVATEAVAGVIDQSISGRRKVQRQKEEDVLLRILPVLNEGLSMLRVPDLRVGCYMILTVLASKVTLEDNVLTAMMDAVAVNWTPATTHAGLICLAVLAQQRQSARLPEKVFKAINAIESLENDLKILNEQYRVDNLTLGLVLGTLDRLHRDQDAYQLSFVRTAIESQLMSTPNISTAVKSILATANNSSPPQDGHLDIQGHLADLILRLMDSKEVGIVVQDTIKDTKIDIEYLEAKLQVVLQPADKIQLQAIEDIDLDDTEFKSQTDDLPKLASHIPTRTAYEISFLSRSESYVFGSLANAFGVASSSSVTVRAFSEFPVLRKSLAMTEPLFLSFFARYWCGPYPASSRSAAIACVRDFFEETEITTDVQALVPYVMFALADPAKSIRGTAAELIMKLTAVFAENDGKGATTKDRPILGFSNIYGGGSETKAISWLSNDDTLKLMRNVLVPSLEECRLDELYISRVFAASLNGSDHGRIPRTSVKELKKSTRAAIMGSLSSHVVNTPLYAVKHRLLSLLNRVEKAGSISRSKALIPLLVGLEKQDEDRTKELCKREGVDEMMFIDGVAKIVSSNDREGIKILQRIIALDDSSPPVSLRKAAFHRIREIWPSMKHDMQLSMSSTLLDLAVRAPKRLTADDFHIEAMDILRNVPLSSEVLLSFLESLPVLSPRPDDGPGNSKRRRTSHGHVESHPGTVSAAVEDVLRHITTILELVTASNAGTSPKLMHGLFQLLADLQLTKGKIGTELAYLQSLVLGCIYEIVERSKGSSDGPIDRAAVRADLIVDCFRTTTSPQVQQAALLLISSLARVLPDLILHSIMPVFTFMGASVLRQADDYSAHVVDQTIDSVVPSLVATLHKQKGGALVGASELLLSFTAAFEHIPIHRRKALFSSLIDKLGAEKFLFALLVLLLDRHADDESVMEFVKDFVGRYSPLIQLKTVDKYLEVALDSLKPKPTYSSHLLGFNNGRTPASSVLNLLSLPPHIFRGNRLISRTAKLLPTIGEDADQDADQLRLVYARLVQQTLLLADQVQPYKKCKWLPGACDEMLDALLNVLPLQESINSLETLLNQGNDTVRRQVLKSLEHRISTDKTGSVAAQQACIKFLSELTFILEKSPDPLLRLAAMSCADRIIEKYGKKNIERLTDVVKTIASDRCLGADVPRLRVMALLCLATSVEVMGDAVISVVPKAVPKATDHLKSSLQEKHKDEALHNAVYTFLGALFSYTPWIITGQYLDRILTISYESANSELPDKCKESRGDVLDLIAKRTEPQECFAALLRTWDNAMVEGPEAVGEYLKILSVAIERQPKSVIAKQSPVLLNIFLGSFDLRRIQCSPRTDDSYEEDEIYEVERSVNTVAIKMIFKLNDASFRPVFIKMQEWATITANSTERKGRIYRMITWYTFLHAFFDTLQSIVTSYASYIIDNAAEVLNTISTDNTDSLTLWNRVISTLHSSFSHDQDEFWRSPTHFSTISGPILAQLAKASHLPLLANLIPCITALAVAADSPEHHKSLNAALLVYMRSDEPAVRLAAVQCEMSITEKLGEEWLSLLPEMLPFISEAQEDDDEKVEREVGRWILKIEGILGESLDSMLM